MSHLHPKLLERLQYVWLVWRRLRDGLTASPRHRGPPAEPQWTTSRDYCPGDDYRDVDWAFCARQDELLTRQCQGEIDSHAYLLLDCSCAMAVGEPSKLAAARSVAAAAAYCALAESQRVGIYAFAERVVAGLVAVRGRSRFAKVLNLLDAISPQPAAADLPAAARALVRQHQRPGPTMVLSGTYDLPGLQRGLENLSYHGYCPRLVRLYDAQEAAPDMLGDVELFDVETGQARLVTVTERDLKYYSQLYAEFCDHLRRYCARRAIPYVELCAGWPERELLLRAMGVRGLPAEKR